MKTYHIFGITLVTGTDADIKKVEKLASGEYHIARNPPKGIPRPRKVKVDNPHTSPQGSAWMDGPAKELGLDKPKY